MSSLSPFWYFLHSYFSSSSSVDKYPIIYVSSSSCRAASMDIPDPPYHSSLLAGPQGYIPYPHIAAVCRFMLVILLLLGHMTGSIGEHHLWACLCFSSNSSMSGSSNFDSFRNERYVAVQLVLCGVLPPGLVQNCSQHSCVVAIKLFFQPFC